METNIKYDQTIIEIKGENFREHLSIEDVTEEIKYRADSSKEILEIEKVILILRRRR